MAPKASASDGKLAAEVCCELKWEGDSEAIQGRKGKERAGWGTISVAMTSIRILSLLPQATPPFFSSCIYASDGWDKF